jgi:ribosomal protein S18 acetylase RimI-like enzyme
MNLQLRHATAEDAVLIADISRQTFYETFASNNTPEDMEKFLSEQFTRGKLILEVGTFNNTFLLAYADEKVAGYAKLREAWSPPMLGTRNTMEIARLYALTSMIGKGVGSFLMESSLNIAREKGKEIVWLGVWEKNQRAIAFYHRWGFEKFAETDFLLGNDIQNDWLMMKRIG